MNCLIEVKIKSVYFGDNVFRPSDAFFTSMDHNSDLSQTKSPLVSALVRILKITHYFF